MLKYIQQLLTKQSNYSSILLRYVLDIIPEWRVIKTIWPLIYVEHKTLCRHWKYINIYTCHYIPKYMYMILSHIRFLKSITRKHNQIQYRTFLIKSNVIIQGNHRAWNFRLRLVKKLLVLIVCLHLKCFWRVNMAVKYCAIIL